MTTYSNQSLPEDRCINCGRPAAEHANWPQCPDGGEGWRARVASYVAERRQVLGDMARLSRKQHSPLWWLVAGFAALVLMLAAVSFYNPHVNVPVISPVMCSIKGDTWYNGGILGPPGCYRPG